MPTSLGVEGLDDGRNGQKPRRNGWDVLRGMCAALGCCWIVSCSCIPTVKPLFETVKKDQVEVPSVSGAITGFSCHD